MWIVEAFKTVSAEFARRAAANRRMAHFVCGDCTRRDMCSMPPNEDCEIRLEQIELYGDEPQRLRR